MHLPLTSENMLELLHAETGTLAHAEPETLAGGVEMSYDSSTITRSHLSLTQEIPHSEEPSRGNF